MANLSTYPSFYSFDRSIPPTTCLSKALATKSAPDLARVLRLPLSLRLTCRMFCACRATGSCPCDSAAPAPKSANDPAKAAAARNSHDHAKVLRAKSVLHLKALRLPRNLRMTARKCFACHEIRVPDLAKVVRVPRNLIAHLAKVLCAPRKMTSRKACVRANHPGAELGPNRSESAPSQRDSFQLVAVPRKFLLNFL